MSPANCKLVTTRETEMVESFWPHQMSEDYLWDYCTEVTQTHKENGLRDHELNKTFPDSFLLHVQNPLVPAPPTVVKVFQGLSREDGAASVLRQWLSPVWGCITLQSDGAEALKELYRDNSALEFCPHQAASLHHTKRLLPVPDATTSNTSTICHPSIPSTMAHAGWCLGTNPPFN